MARARFEGLGLERQEALLAAAAEEFAERGYEGASLNRIVERAGSSKGSIYYYFENKADLLSTVVERAMARVMSDVAFPRLEEFTAEDYWDRVRDLALTSLPLMEMDTWYMRVIRAFFRLSEEPAAREAMGHVMEQNKRLVRTFLQHGRDLGVVRSDLPLELLVEIYMAADQAGDRWMVRHWDEMDEGAKQALLAARVDLSRDMLDARHVGWDR